MTAVGDVQFRLDNDSLAFRFTATLSDRYGMTLERLATPDALGRWWQLNDLWFGGPALDERDLTHARELREAIHRLGTGVATTGKLDPRDVDIVNDCARSGAAYLVLAGTDAVWETTTQSTNIAAMGIVAQDAIRLLGGELSSRVRICDRTECRGLFVDTSRAGNRRWCSMNTCGNRQKKAQMKTHTGRKARS